MSFSYVSIPFDDSLPLENCEVSIEETKSNEWIEKHIYHRFLNSSVKVTVLLRSSKTASDEKVAGLFAYSCDNVQSQNDIDRINIRASRLAMSCGLLSLKFNGNVVVMRSYGSILADTSGLCSATLCRSLVINDIYGACCVSPDLRLAIQKELCAQDDGLRYCEIPLWLANAAQQNYHDESTIAQLAAVFITGSSDSSSTSSDSSSEFVTEDEENQPATNQKRQFVAESSLCLHCRGPTENLCPSCHGAYFCELPRTCQSSGWSHKSWCRTWERYTDHRRELSNFSFDKWHLKLLQRDFQMSDQPYQDYLTREIFFVKDCPSWWSTEVDGWSGGESSSAHIVDASCRRSYEEGFSPIKAIPPEKHVTTEDERNCTIEPSKNSCDLLLLSSWEQYYELRKIEKSSPAALLLTFPLTLYYAIVKYGEVPVTVSKMLKRPLRIHVVGIEKELNFLDLFKEIGFLLPDLKIELTFIIRKDMLPPKCRTDSDSDNKYSMKLNLTTNLDLLIVDGTYGTADLDPRFDCGKGPPDMVIGMNAGLYAYKSWRSVIEYLHDNDSVVAVFTDYNEHSGMNCASLGGAKSRESLCINPFRQPRAMPVYCMNLPQFSNGFFYVYNEQHLDF